MADILKLRSLRPTQFVSENPTQEQVNACIYIRRGGDSQSGAQLADTVREDLIAERIVIEVYSDMIRHFGNNDPTTRIMVEKILRDEEEHASDLSDLLFIMDPHTGQTEGQDPGTDPLHHQKKPKEAA